MNDESAQAQAKQIAELLDSMHDAITALTLPDRKLIFVSKWFEKIYVYPLQKFLDDPDFFKQVVYPDDLEGAILGMEQCMTNGYAEFEHRIVWPDGQIRWLQRRAWLSFDENGHPFQLTDTARDITSIKATEKALSTSEEKFLKIFTASPDSIIISSLEDGIYIDVNDSFLRDTGYTRDEIIGQSAIALNIWVNPEERSYLVNRLRNQGYARSLEIQYRKKSGEIRYGQISLEIIELNGKHCLLSIVRDIHDHKLTKLNLEESEARYRSLVEGSPYAIGVLQDEKIVFTNEAGVRLLAGHKPEDVIGLSIGDLISSETQTAARERLRRMIKGEVNLHPIENTWVRLDGGLIPVEISTVPITYNGRIATQFIVTNVTERHRAHARILHLNRLLSFLSQVNQAIVRVRDEATLYREACRIAVTYGQFRMAWIGLADSASGTVQVSAFDGHEDGYVTNVRISFLDEPAGHGPTGSAVRNGEYFVCDDIEHDPRLKPWRAEALRRGYRSSAAFPIRKNNQVIGALTLYGSEPNFFDPEIISVLEEVCGDISYALEGFEREKHRGVAEEHFSTIFNLSPLPIILASIDEGRILDINKAAFELFGFNIDTTIGHTTRELNFWVDPVERANFIRKTGEAGRLTNYEFRFRKQSGEVRQGLISAALLELQGQRYTLGIIEDITERKQNEAALRQSERRYRQMFEAHGLPKLIIDPFTGTILDANPAAGKFYGYDLATIRTRTLFDLSTVPESLIRQTMVKAVESDIFSNDYIHRAAGGVLRNVTIFTAPVEFDNNRVALYTIITDVTEKHRAQESLQEARALLEQRVIERTGELAHTKDQLEAIFNHSSDGILLIGENQIIQQANFAFDALMAIPSGGSLGAPFTRFFQLSAIAEIESRLAEVATTGQTLHVEALAQRSDGTTFDAELSFAPFNRFDHLVISMVCIIRDITLRKAAQEALQANEVRFRRLIEGAPIAVIASNSRGQIVLVNESAMILFGYNRGELLEKPLEMLMPSYSRSIHTGNWPETQRTGTLEVSGQGKNGRQVPLEINLVSVDWPEGPVEIAYIIDITQRIQIESALRQALAQEKELGDLKSRFVSTASHEFRTPLAAILSTVETLDIYRHRMTEEQIGDRLSKIRQQVFHMRSIMDDVLQLTRIQAGKMEFSPAEADLRELCRTIVDEFDEQTQYHGRLVFECAAESIRTEFDAKLMRQAINNLITNALKYSAEETKVTVTLQLEGDQIVFAVNDHGIGIPPADLKRLFEPFHRASNVGSISGTGLGLSIIQQAIEFHSGTINVESHENVGSTFTVTIPRKVNS